MGNPIKLTQKDWSEIYYALDSKQRAVAQGFYGSPEEEKKIRQWASHLSAIMRKIGPDGGKAAERGIIPHKPTTGTQQS